MTFNHEIKIMKDCPYDVLVGIDFMSQIKGMARDLVSGNLIPIESHERKDKHIISLG